MPPALLKSGMSYKAEVPGKGESLKDLSANLIDPEKDKPRTGLDRMLQVLIKHRLVKTAKQRKVSDVIGDFDYLGTFSRTLQKNH